MQNDQRLTPLPVTNDIQPTRLDFPTAYAASYDDTMDSRRSLRQYINIVYKRLPLILAITILVTAAVAFYSYRLPSEYIASTGMIIEPRKPPQTKKDAININFGDDQKYYNTQIQLLKDVGLMQRVVIALGLHRDANLFGDQGRGLLGGLRSLFTRGQKADEADNSLPVVSNNDAGRDAIDNLTAEEKRRAESYASNLVTNLKVEQQDRTNLVTLTLQTSNPAVAPKITDKVAELFIKEDADRETGGAQQALDDLRKSIEDLKGTIHQQEETYIQAMTNSDLSMGDKASEVRLADLQALLTQWRLAQADEAKAEGGYNAAVEANRSGNILAVATENKAIQDLRSANEKRKVDGEKRIQEIDTKIDERNQKKKELLAKYTEEYAPVVAVKAEITELEAQKGRVRGEIENTTKIEDSKLVQKAATEQLAGLRAVLSAAQQREAKQRVSFEQAAAKANVQGQKETNIIGLKHEMDSNRLLLDTYTQREKEQDLALKSDAPNNIKLQSHAVTPTTPTGPQRGRNILVALFLSLGAGIGLAFLLDFLDDSVRTSDDITRHLGLPTLALIPHYLNSDKKKLLAATNGNGNGSGIPATAALITMEERHSPMAEAYRHLRTSLLFSSAGKPPQTILITSSQPSEGKTTTAINTAITLAQSDVDVVIIDCDLRRPRLHQYFGLENTSGLTNYLSGDKSTENLLRTYKDLPRLKIITSGPIPPNPAELLSSNEMRNLLQFLSGRFKHVIIDSPPAISFTDASILSTLVDGVVLVAMANKSSIHLMRQFKQRVSAIGARIYGVVLNGIKSSSDEYYYYGSGYYKYYSQADDESTPFLEDQVLEDQAKAATHETKS